MQNNGGNGLKKGTLTERSWKSENANKNSGGEDDVRRSKKRGSPRILLTISPTTPKYLDPNTNSGAIPARKRKSRTLANLHSDLSPKYIGLISPPSSCFTDTENLQETLPASRKLRNRICVISPQARLIEMEMQSASESNEQLKMAILPPEDAGTAAQTHKPYNVHESRRLQRVGRPGRSALKKNTKGTLILANCEEMVHRMYENVDVEALIPFNMIEEVRGNDNEINIINNGSTEILGSEDKIGLKQELTEIEILRADVKSTTIKDIPDYSNGLTVLTMYEEDHTADDGSGSEVEDKAEAVVSHMNSDIDNVAAKSPSAISLDSAKGSSVVNDAGSCISFTTGDLFWGRLFSYCYWPCLVCPDPEERIITTQVGRNGESQMLVHVRFFADNGRRNWVKCENLIAFYGLEEYNELVDEERRKYGVKSARYRSMLPKPNRQYIWYIAINEASLLANMPNNERLETFLANQQSKMPQLKRRKRSSSLSLLLECASTSDLGSVSDDWESHLVMKRERSSSPSSLALSPLKRNASKRRKLSDMPPQESMQDTALPLHSSQTIMKLHEDVELRKLHAAIKDFVTLGGHFSNEQIEKNLIGAVRNIWQMRAISLRHREEHLLQDYNKNMLGSSLIPLNRSNGSVKRLSNRLKGIMVRRNLPEVVGEKSQATTQKTNFSTEQKPKQTKNRHIDLVIEHIYDLDRKYLFKGLGREPVCKYCLQAGRDLQPCAKSCRTWLHANCAGNRAASSAAVTNGKQAHIKKRASNVAATLEPMPKTKVTVEPAISVLPGNETPTTPAEIICVECNVNSERRCQVCNGVDAGERPLVACHMPHCENTYHQQCCRYWPQAKFTMSQHKVQSFRCPTHVCHTCVSDDPKGKFQHLSSSKLTRCLKCPATYHTDSTCIPAGSIIVNAAHIVCPRHSASKTDASLNVSWCFICVGGGQLVCCDTCPIAVHAQCMNLQANSNEPYVCEECESGRLPLYGEMVWAKFNAFRWWPAIILPPPEIPQNIARKVHRPSDFVVRFFGTHDHGWISRRRVYLYLEGDSSQPPKTKSNMDLNYVRGVDEAQRAYELIKLKKLTQRLSNAGKEKLHPQPYVRIKTNRAVPPLKLHINLDKVNKCDCLADAENPCAADTNCLNRVLYHECNPKLCPAGERCQNQMFETRISPSLEVMYMGERGFGLVCRESILAGNFIIEYVGEIINHAEFQQRLAQKSVDRDENFYFFSVEKDYIIDAGPRGNLARFMNHSCDPNCETQKWQVNGLNRVGLFAIKDIAANTELTFNYHWDELLGTEKKTCFCGAEKCAGQIGGKYREIKSKINDGPVQRALKGTQPKRKHKVRRNGKLTKNSAIPVKIRLSGTQLKRVKQTGSNNGTTTVVDTIASAVEQQQEP